MYRICTNVCMRVHERVHMYMHICVCTCMVCACRVRTCVCVCVLPSRSASERGPERCSEVREPEERELVIDNLTQMSPTTGGGQREGQVGTLLPWPLRLFSQPQDGETCHSVA